MNEYIKSFVPFKQEFNPVKLYEVINTFNQDQLIELNEYLTGDEMKDNPELYQTRDDFLDNPIVYLSELCQEERKVGHRFMIEYDNIWEERFSFVDEVERIQDER
jgi:hypothetical protein